MENNENYELDDATKAFADATKKQKENNIQNEEQNMKNTENEIKNEQKVEAEEKKKSCKKTKIKETINMSIAIGIAGLFCFGSIIFFFL